MDRTARPEITSPNTHGGGAAALIFDEMLGEFVPAAENEFAARWHNLADPRLGAAAISATDEWFAPKTRLLDHKPPRFIANEYDDHGKWMDGWETRRLRIPGHDHCVVRLAGAGRIRGVNIDTSHFTGNYPPFASIDACHSKSGPDVSTKWIEVLPAVPLRGHVSNLFPVENDGVWTHVRLNIYPDGGVARLRVYGDFHLDRQAAGDAPVNLAAIEHGAWMVACSDQHYGSPANILYPGIGASMAEGWETRRRREPGNEWAIFRLARPGTVRQIVVDTTHFKGNYPDRCSIQAATLSDNEAMATTASMFWDELLPEQKLEMNRAHAFEKEIVHLGPVTHVRFNLIPDGGVNRLRLIGTQVPPAR
ncbi:MAG: allantoicase [Parvibaculaceae bacterium]